MPTEVAPGRTQRSGRASPFGLSNGQRTAYPLLTALPGWRLPDHSSLRVDSTGPGDAWRVADWGRPNPRSRIAAALVVFAAPRSVSMMGRGCAGGLVASGPWSSPPRLGLAPAHGRWRTHMALGNFFVFL